MDDLHSLKMLDILAELHEWELANLPVFQTTTGRHLYFAMIRELAGRPEGGSKALKELFGSSHFTVKAMRLRMQALLEEGYLQVQEGQKDGRVRHLVPTPAFEEAMAHHAQQVAKLVNRHFILVQK